MDNNKQTKREKKSDKVNLLGLLTAIILIAVLILFLTPIILKLTLFKNGISSASNQSWSSFLGSFLGGLIGAVIAAIATLYGIKLTIEYNTRMIRDERTLQIVKDEIKEIKSNMPNFYIINNDGCGGACENSCYLASVNKNNVVMGKFQLTNFGMNTAINLTCVVPFHDTSQNINIILERDLFRNKKIILKDEKYDFKLGIQKVDKTDITLIFNDLLGNIYNQKILFNYNDLSDPKVSCINCNPELVRAIKLNQINNEI